MSMTDTGLTSTTQHVSLTTRRKVKVGKSSVQYNRWIVMNNCDIPVDVGDRTLYKGMVRSMDKPPTVKAHQRGAVITVTSYKKDKYVKRSSSSESEDVR